MRGRLTIAASAMLCILFLAALVSAQDRGSLAVTTKGGEGRIGSDVREVDMGAIPQATAAELSTHIREQERPLDGRTEEQFRAMKQQAAMLGGNQPSASAGPAPTMSGALVAQTHKWVGQGEICCTPSDMALAVSPTWVVQFVNTYIAVYNKTGVLQAGYPKSADTFFGLPAGTYTTDPRGFYDWTNGRFVFVMLTESSFSSNNVGQLMVAVSATGNPTGLWHIIKFQVGNTGECPDYPTLGHDTNNWGANGTKGVIYVGINQFSNNCNGGFIQNYLFSIAKDALYAGTGYHYWYEFGFTVGGTLVDTLQPANPQGPGDRPAAEYVVNSYNILFNCQNGCSGLTLWGVSNPVAWINGGPGPTFTGVGLGTTHTYYYPPAANQPGDSQSVETIDTRISGSVYYHAGHLYGSLDTGVPNVAGSHAIWFDYHPLLNSSANAGVVGGDERQEDCFFCGGQGSSGSSYFATLIPDSDNNLTMTYTFSDNVTYPEMAITGRRVSYADSNQNGAGFTPTGGSGLYTQFRWGDYSAVAPDNTTASSPQMWVAGDYDAGGNWGTFISEEAFNKPTVQ